MGRKYYQCKDCGRELFNPEPDEFECSNCGSFDFMDGYSPDYEVEKQNELKSQSLEIKIPAFYKNINELSDYVAGVLADKNLLKEISIETQAFNTVRINEATELKLKMKDDAYLKLFISKEYFNANLYNGNNFCINRIDGKPSQEESKQLKNISKTIMNNYVEKYL